MITDSSTYRRDDKTCAPFVLHDWRESESKDVRLEFNNWDLLQAKVGDDRIGDYYLNGPGVQGLVIGARILAGLDPMPAGMMPNSEGDTCYIHFGDMDTAIETARLAQAMIGDRTKIEACAQVAADEGFDDI